MLVYDLDGDPGESETLSAERVDEAALRAAYAATLSPFDTARVAAPTPPPLDPAEAARLEALGYLVPGGPPGPPPGQGSQERPPREDKAPSPSR